MLDLEYSGEESRHVREFAGTCETAIASSFELRKSEQKEG